MDLTGFLEILEHYLGSGNALSAQLDLETKLNNQSLKHMLHTFINHMRYVIVRMCIIKFVTSSNLDTTT